MYKCKECGTEFETKPDYCDCGNDTFEEVIIQEEKKIAPPIENNKSHEVKVQQEKPLKELEIKDNNNKVQTKISDKNINIKPYAIIIFVLCLILSVLVILFAWNPKPSNEIQNTNSATETEQKQIPKIEKIWNNKLPEISAVRENKTKEQTKTVQQKLTPEVKPISQPKPQTPKATTNKQSQTPKTSVQKATVNKQQTTQNLTPQKVTQSTPIVKQTVSANPQEIANYKIKLRNHIASKILFTSIVGDGSCTFSFSVASNGELTNKKPVELSDNESLNEAVYNALRQVYSYNAPPIGYKGKTLKLNVKMYNNNFEVSLN